LNDVRARGEQILDLVVDGDRVVIAAASALG